nr:hypothetical protein [Tanacetum cinerariifolium]
SRTYKIKRLYKVSLTARVISSSDDEALDKEDTSKQRKIDEIDADKDIALVSTHDDASNQDNIVQDEGIEDVGKKEVVEVVTTAKMLIDTVVDATQVTTAVAETIVTTAPTITAESTKTKVEVTQAPKRKRVIFKSQRKQKQQKQFLYNNLRFRTKPRALKNKSFAEIQELFDKAMKRINNFVDFRTKLVEESSKKDEAETTQESSSKREGDELKQERSKKQKVEDDKESKELKKCLEIIPDDGDDVTIDATPLSSKSPTIVDYKIYKEVKKNYFQIFRVGGNSQMYLTFNKMLKNFDREDLEVLWRLVKARFEKVQLVDHMDNFLMHTLKTMFEHHVEDNVWKNQQGLTKVKN